MGTSPSIPHRYSVMKLFSTFLLDFGNSFGPTNSDTFITSDALFAMEYKSMLVPKNIDFTDYVSGANFNTVETPDAFICVKSDKFSGM